MKILAIGNSFSDDASTYLHQIGKTGGTDIKIISLCIGGCPFKLHWENALSEAKAYSTRLNGEDYKDNVSINEILESDDFDIITFQQGSILSGKPETYYPYIENLFHFVKAIHPEAEILIHQTWAYEKGFDRLSEYENSQDVMFQSLKQAYNEAAERLGILNGAPVRIIPCGEAMQMARENPLFNSAFGDGNPLSMNRDGFHASLQYGRYLLGAVWYEVLTGKNIFSNPFKPEGTEVEIIELLKQVAHKAVMQYR